MHMVGQTEAALKYLKGNLDILERQEYVDENLKTKYIWAIKTMMRQELLFTTIKDLSAVCQGNTHSEHVETVVLLERK